MTTQKYECILPKSAMQIRNAVFVEEQGFVDEYDEIDKIATHFVSFDGEEPIATCRVFCTNDPKTYYLGRLAVVRSRRGQHIGAEIVSVAEAYIRDHGGMRILLHSQCNAAGFYAAIGYNETNERDEEQGCPHVWMVKQLN